MYLWKRVLSSALVFSTVLFISNSFAKPTGIPCPSTETIRNTAKVMSLEVRMVRDGYVLQSQTEFRHANRGWFYATFVKANSKEEALELGKEVIQNIKYSFNTNAEKKGGAYICLYTGKNGELINVATPAK